MVTRYKPLIPTAVIAHNSAPMNYTGHSPPWGIKVEFGLYPASTEPKRPPIYFLEQYIHNNTVYTILNTYTTLLTNGAVVCIEAGCLI